MGTVIAYFRIMCRSTVALLGALALGVLVPAIGWGTRLRISQSITLRAWTSRSSASSFGMS